MRTPGKYWQRVAVLAFGHGLNDFTAGYMLGNLLYLDLGFTNIAVGFLVYNTLAFGGQYFAALLLRKVSNTKMVITASAAANFLAVVIFSFLPQLSLVLAGCASAVYHVAGGAACIRENKAAPIGVFAAPGIVGLALAGYFAYLHSDLWLVLSFVCAAFLLLVQFLSLHETGSQPQSNGVKVHAAIDRHDLMMILLLGIIALRSAVWNIFQVIHEHHYTWLLAIAFSAFAGKIAGGWISDRVGWKLYSLVSLATAMPLLSFFKEEIILFCIGIGLLQSAIPANTAMMIEYCKGQKEKGVALSFGTAIVAGIVLTAPVEVFAVNAFIFWLLLVLLLFSIVLLRKRKTFPFKNLVSR